MKFKSPHWSSLNFVRIIKMPPRLNNIYQCLKFLCHFAEAQTSLLIPYNWIYLLTKREKDSFSSFFFALNNSSFLEMNEREKKKKEMKLYFPFFSLPSLLLFFARSSNRDCNSKWKTELKTWVIRGGEKLLNNDAFFNDYSSLS